MAQNGVTLAKGYLLKHNRDHRSANLLPGAKYKRRWVEVTADTMVYAPSQQDALTGHIQVFSIGDMVWVKPSSDTKFLIKFHERTLKFKVAAGGKEEREQWVAALQAARRQHQEAQQKRNSGAGKLEHLQKALLPPGPDPIAGLSSFAESDRSSEAGSMVLSSAGVSLDGTSLAGAYSRGSTVPGLNFTGSTFGGSVEPTGLSGSQGSLSPRSLLASARAGMALVSSASPAGTPRARTPPSAAAATLAAPAHLRQGRFIVQEVGGSEDSDSEAESEGASSDAEQQHEEESSAEPSIDGAAATAACAGSLPTAAAAAVGVSTQRPPLARRTTPGVLLASPRPTTPSAAAAAAAVSAAAAEPGHLSPLSGMSPRPSTFAASPLAAAAQQPAAPKPAFALNMAHADEVLRLDDSSESEPNSPQAQHQHMLVTHSPHVNAAPSPQQQQGSRPTSASYSNRSSAAEGASLQPSDVYSTTLYCTHRPSSGSRSRVSAQAPAAAAAAAAAAVASAAGDEVLRLDEEEVMTTPIRPFSANQQQQQPLQAQQQYSSGIGYRLSAEAGSGSLQPSSLRPGALQVGSRPGSAGSRPGSAYRPGTPLKSCLRNSPTTNHAGFTP